jgi:hypothetical protein
MAIALSDVSFRGQSGHRPIFCGANAEDPMRRDKIQRARAV